MNYTTKTIQKICFTLVFALFGLSVANAQTNATSTPLPAPAPAPTSTPVTVTQPPAPDPVLVPYTPPTVTNPTAPVVTPVPTPDIVPIAPTTPISSPTPTVTPPPIDTPLPTVTSTSTPPPATTTIPTTTPTPIKIPRAATLDLPTGKQIPALSRAADNSALMRYLVVGSSHAEVALLQRFLNEKGYTIAKSGPGSPGNESSYFGNATKRALMDFQKANGITPTGTLGPITRGLVNKMMK